MAVSVSSAARFSILRKSPDGGSGNHVRAFLPPNGDYGTPTDHGAPAPSDAPPAAAVGPADAAPAPGPPAAPDHPATPAVKAANPA